MKYRDYYRELIVESLSLKFKEGNTFTDEQKAKAKEALNSYIRNSYKYYTDDFGKLMINRYDFILKGIREHWREDIYEFEYVGKGGREGSESWFPDSEQASLRNMRKSVRRYRTLKNVIDDIPVNVDSAYRGMSFEELLNAKRKGYFQTNSSMTIGDSQVGYTFFGDTPSTAKYYSMGFQPMPSSGTRNKPAVIIEVPKSILTKASETMSNVTGKPVGSENEYVTNRRIEFSDVLNLWLAVPEKSSYGSVEVVYDKYENRYKEGSRFGAGNWYKLISKRGMI